MPLALLFINRFNATKMNNIRFLLIISFVCCFLPRQKGLVHQIQTQYALLDTISYQRLLVEKYRQTQYDNIRILINGSDNDVVRQFCFGYEDEDSVEIHNAAALLKQFARVDTAYYDNLIEQFVEKVNRPNPYYVLKLEVSNGEVNIDTSEL